MRILVGNPQMATPENFIAESKFVKSAKRLVKLLQDQVFYNNEAWCKVRAKKDEKCTINYSSGQYTVTGTPNDLSIEYKKNYSESIEHVGKIKYKVKYNATLKNLNIAIGDVIGQSISTSQAMTQDSPNQKYIWTSENVLDSTGYVDVSKLIPSESDQLITIKDIKLIVDGITGKTKKDLGQFSVTPSMSNVGPALIGFDTYIAIPSTTLQKADCKEGDVSLGPVYSSPKYETDAGVGFTYAPKYESIYVENLQMGSLIAATVDSLEQSVPEIDSKWSDKVCGEVTKYGGTCPKPELPKVGAKESSLNDTLEQVINKTLASTDLSAELDPLIKRWWKKRAYSEKRKSVSVFTGDEVTCATLQGEYVASLNPPVVLPTDKQIEQCEEDYLNGLISEKQLEKCLEPTVS